MQDLTPRPFISERLDAQPFDPLEVAAVVCQDGKIVTECGGADEEIEIAYHRTAST